MNEQQYIETRVKDQIKWYSDKSGSNQKFFKFFKITEIICAVSIPFLASYISAFWTGLIGAIVAVIAGILSIYKFQDNWVKYRTTSETLKHHLNLFQTKVEPYNDENRFSKFVHNIEGMISKENSEWQSYTVQNNTEVNNLNK
jgi:hypothetical protein